MKCLVTGGAGFIGTNLVNLLLKNGHEVLILDDLRNRFLNSEHVVNENLIKVDLLNHLNDWKKYFKGVDVVYHLAANADIRSGWKHPRTDLEQNLLVTINVLEASVEFNVKDFVFTSTGSVYGNTSQIPTLENSSFPIQTSLYSAAKLSSEAFISAFCEANKIRGTVFRLVSTLGQGYSHGHIFDFYQQLFKNPRKLKVLGNGHQKKSYINVKDCVKGLTEIRGRNNYEIFNLGTNEFCSVRQSISWILDELKVDPQIEFGDEKQGWIGDNPFIWLNIDKSKATGWSPQFSIEESVRETVNWLKMNRKI